MEQYQLEVSGVDGARAATVKFGNEVIDTFPVKNIKDAERQAAAVAIRHKNENRPATLERFTKTFTV